MIAKLKGILDITGTGHAVVDVNGVGYLVQASSRTLAQLGRTGDPVTLYIETQVREDAISLYGFADAQEKAWFRLLTTVQGVGAKAALAILAVLSPDELPVAIAAQDKAALTRAEGVGPKLAARILTELKDKAGDLVLGEAAARTAATALKQAGAVPSSGASGDAVSALVNLGYGRTEAFGAVSAAARNLGTDADVQILIRESLKELSA